MTPISLSTSKIYLAQAQEESETLQTILENLDESTVDHVAVHFQFQDTLKRIESLKKQLLQPEDEREFQSHLGACTLLSGQIEEYYQNYLKTSMETVVIQTRIVEASGSSPDLLDTCHRIGRCIKDILTINSQLKHNTEIVYAVSVISPFLSKQHHYPHVHFSASNSSSGHSVSSSSSSSFDSAGSVPCIDPLTSTAFDAQDKIAELKKMIQELGEIRQKLLEDECTLSLTYFEEIVAEFTKLIDRSKSIVWPQEHVQEFLVALREFDLAVKSVINTFVPRILKYISDTYDQAQYLSEKTRFLSEDISTYEMINQSNITLQKIIERFDDGMSTRNATVLETTKILQRIQLKLFSQNQISSSSSSTAFSDNSSSSVSSTSQSGLELTADPVNSEMPNTILSQFLLGVDKNRVVEILPLTHKDESYRPSFSLSSSSSYSSSSSLSSTSSTSLYSESSSSSLSSSSSGNSVSGIAYDPSIASSEENLERLNGIIKEFLVIKEKFDSDGLHASDIDYCASIVIECTALKEMGNQLIAQLGKAKDLPGAKETIAYCLRVYKDIQRSYEKYTNHFFDEINSQTQWLKINQPKLSPEKISDVCATIKRKISIMYKISKSLREGQAFKNAIETLKQLHIPFTQDLYSSSSSESSSSSSSSSSSIPVIIVPEGYIMKASLISADDQCDDDLQRAIALSHAQDPTPVDPDGDEALQRALLLSLDSKKQDIPLKKR